MRTKGIFHISVHKNMADVRTHGNIPADLRKRLTQSFIVATLHQQHKHRCVILDSITNLTSSGNVSLLEDK